MAPLDHIPADLIIRNKKIIFFAVVSCFFLFAAFSPSEGKENESVVVNIMLNNEEKGEFFAYLTDAGDYLVRVEDLKSIGFQDPQGVLTQIGDTTYISLGSMKDVSFTFNEKTVSLEITASPRLLPTKAIDFYPQRREGVYFPKDTSAFLNYGFSYTGGNSPDVESFNLTNQLGWRLSDFLFLTDSIYTKSRTDERFVRLMSNVSYETRKDLNRLVLGDSLATSGTLGSSINLGGLSFSKNYQIDPYIIKQPMVDYTGFATLPSEMNVYVDGARVKTEKLSPGKFDLQNILAYGGTHDLEIVLKDAFGREQKLKYPFYVTDLLLRRGFHEFSYNAGFLREDYGTESNSYGKFAYTGFHRYGINDMVTIGFRGEGTTNLYNLGPQISYLVGNLGIASMSVSSSLGNADSKGFAGSLGYLYQGKSFNARLLANAYTEDYSVITTLPTDEKSKYELGAGMGYSVPELGSLSFDFAKIKKYQGFDRESYTLSFSRNITKNSSLYLTFRHTKDEDSNNEVTLGITYYPWKDTFLTFHYAQDQNKNTETLQIQKNTPIGEGFSYRASVGRSDAQDGESQSLNPYIQYNGKYGIYSAEYRGQYSKTGTDENYTLSTSGSMAYVGNTIGFSRPINDSFSIVKVGDIKGVTVYQNSQEVGKTDSSGKLIVPTLTSYTDNNISINDQNIPLNYSIPKVTVYVAPPLRSGTLLKFDASKIQAVTGKLNIKIDGITKPIENEEGTITVEGKAITFPIAQDGEFYIENIPPGTYKATLNYMKKPFTFSITIPKSDDVIIDLGGVTIEDIR